MLEYYDYWERALYQAVVQMTLSNLDAYCGLLLRESPEDSPCSTVQTLLRGAEIVLEPDAASIVEGSLTVVKGIIEGSKKFVRHLRGTWIPAREMRSTASIRASVPSFYDDIISLRSVKTKVDKIQDALIQLMKVRHAPSSYSFRQLTGF